jgi:hypothetical protein
VNGEVGGLLREWLAWFDEAGNPYPLPSQLIRQERQRAAELAQALEQERLEKGLEQQRAAELAQALEQERLEKLCLLEKLRQLGIES